MAANTKFGVAIHTAAILASHPGGFVTSEKIAASVNTNPVVIRRILCELCDAGIVECRTGKSGGAKLSKKADKITLWDVYCATEKDSEQCCGIFALPSKPENKRCAISCAMKTLLENVFKGAEKALQKSLKKTSLKDIVQTI